MHQYFFHSGEEQVGPLEGLAAIDFAAKHPDAYCWRQGFAEWLPVRSVAELTPEIGPMRTPWGAAHVPPAPSALRRSRADEIDFRIHGEEMQFVEVELDPGESAIAEAGAMMYKDSGIEMTTVFGDGSGPQGGGFLDKLIGAGKRVITGESLFTTVFTHRGGGKGRVAFAAPFPGTILPLNLADLGGTLICQKDSFLAAAKGVSVGIFFQRKILTGLFGGEGFIMQKLDGDGWVFAHVGGTVVERQLAPGEVLHVDTGCLAAMTPDVEFDLVQVGGIKSMVFAGEGVFFAALRGPGRVWLQSLPFSRLAGRMLAAAAPGGGKGEGSILGPLGDMVMGGR